MNLGDSYGNPGSSDKCIAMIPERVMMAMVKSGWILRNKVVWNKPNPMPESVKDRFSTSWEYIYMFSLQENYYFDLDAVREPHKSDPDKKTLSTGNSTKYASQLKSITTKGLHSENAKGNAFHNNGKTLAIHGE